MEDSKSNFFKETRHELEQYIQDRLLLLKLQAAEKTGRIVALLFSILVVALLAFFVVLFFSIMAGYYFSGLTGSFFAGFGIVAAFYIILLAVVVLARKWISEKITDIVIRIFFDKADEDNEAL